jgi:hypothetical protein
LPDRATLKHEHDCDEPYHARKNRVKVAGRIGADAPEAGATSCGILTYDHRLVSVEEALPIHVTALELTTKPITELFDDIKEGDAPQQFAVLRRHASCRPHALHAGLL